MAAKRGGGKSNQSCNIIRDKHYCHAGSWFSLTPYSSPAKMAPKQYPHRYVTARIRITMNKKITQTAVFIWPVTGQIDLREAT